MKNLFTIALCVILSLYSLCSSAQHNAIPINEPNKNRPKLFQNLPESIPVNLPNISGLFNSQVGRNVSVSLSDTVNFHFNGSVVSIKTEVGQESVVVRSSNYQGACLTISKIVDERGSTSYVGRIVSMQHGDLYELKTVNDQLMFVKRNFYDLVNE